MVIAIVVAGMLGGLVSGGAALFALDLGWIATICGFYGGAFGAMGLVALRIALIRDDRETPRREPHAPDPGIARAG